MSKGQQKLEFSGTWTEPHPAALGCWVVCRSELINKRMGIQQALACLFGPVGTALRGGSAKDVESAISQSQMIFDSYMTNARLIVGSSEVNTASPASNVNGIAPSSVGQKVTQLPLEEDDLIDME